MALTNPEQNAEILREAQEVLDFQQDTVNPENRVDVRASILTNPVAAGAVISQAQFRVATRPRSVEASWRATHHVTGSLIRALRNLNADVQLGPRFFRSAAELFFLSIRRPNRGEPEEDFRRRAREFGQTNGNLAFFRGNSGAWNYLKGYGAALMVDVQKGLRRPQGPANTVEQTFTFHTENLASALNSSNVALRLREPLERYARDLNSRHSNYNFLAGDRLQERRILGMYAIRLRMIEEIYGTYDFSPQKLRETMDGLVRVLEAATQEIAPRTPRWKSLEDAE